MDPKSFLKSFCQLINVARIAGVQALSIILVAYVAGHFAVIKGVRGCPSFGDPFNIYVWFFGLVGLVATFVALFYIIFPAIWMQNIDRLLAFSTTG